METVDDASNDVGNEGKSEATAPVEKAKPEKPAPAKPSKPAIGTSAGARTKVVQSASLAGEVRILRRTIIWTSVAGFLVACLLMFLRFFLPRAIFEPNTVFRIGLPGDFGIGVDTKFQQQYRIWVVRNAERLFVIYARCTHLGCTPDWKAGENKFKCPCHGSGYDSEGVNFEGPAPRPMDRAHIELDAEGQLVVNTARLYSWERDKGKDSQFNDHDSGGTGGAYISV